MRLVTLLLLAASLLVIGLTGCGGGNNSVPSAYASLTVSLTVDSRDGVAQEGTGAYQADPNETVAIQATWYIGQDPITKPEEIRSKFQAEIQLALEQSVNVAKGGPPCETATAVMEHGTQTIRYIAEAPDGTRWEKSVNIEWVDSKPEVRILGLFTEDNLPYHRVLRIALDNTKGQTPVEAMASLKITGQEIIVAVEYDGHRVNKICIAEGDATIRDDKWLLSVWNGVLTTTAKGGALSGEIKFGTIPRGAMAYADIRLDIGRA